MKTTLTLSALVAACLLAAPVTAKEWKTVRFGVEGAYPPFSWTDASGEIKGFDIDLANALCQQMAVRCELVAQDWDGMIPALLSRKYDAIMSSMNITDERRQKVDFSQVYYMMQNRLVGRSDKAADFADDPAHFKGKVIAVQEGTPQDNFVTARYGEVAKIKRYVNAQSPMLDLQSGRADYTFGNMVQLKVGFLDKEMGKQFAFVGPQFNGTQDKILGEGVAVALRKHDDKLKARFDAAIESVKADGTFKALTIDTLAKIKERGAVNLGVRDSSGLA